MIGEGRSRKCYIHPDDNNLCIKVSHKKAFQRSAKREVGYYKRLQKRDTSFDMIAKYLYTVQTDQGEGEVFELIRDYDGDVSKSVRYYLNLKDDDMNKNIITLLEGLRQYLKREYILFSDLHLRNILLMKMTKTEYKLVVIDGLGDNNQIPLLEYVHVLGEKRSIKKWKQFRAEWFKQFPGLVGNIKQFNE